MHCDNRIHRLHKDFLLSVSASVEEQIELKNIMDNGYASYKETSEKLRGVIGKVLSTVTFSVSQ